MTARERFLATMNFEPCDHVPYWEITGFWDETLERWHNEGLPEDTDFDAFFGLDRWDLVPVNLDFLPLFPEQILEEDASYTLIRQSDGVVRRIPKEPGGLALDVDFPVKSLDDFEKICAERLNPQDPARYDEDWEALVQEFGERDYPVGIRLGYLFSWSLELMGVENASMAFYDQPELMEAILDFTDTFILDTIDKALAEIPNIDFAFFRENITSNTGSMISPRVIQEHVLPHYRHVTDAVRQRGIDLIFMESDGNCDQLLPLWMEAGINGLYPLEVAAGQDPVRIREAFPNLRLIGGIDKRELAKGHAEIDQEIVAKVPHLVKSGGWIPSLDHSVPPEVSLANYQYYWLQLRTEAEKTSR